MARCRQLHQENDELGAMISKGRLAKLESELALQKSFSEEVKKSQSGSLIPHQIAVLSLALVRTQYISVVGIV